LKGNDSGLSRVEHIEHSEGSALSVIVCDKKITEAEIDRTP